MVSFLTSLTSIGSQAAEAHEGARQEKEARANKIHQMDVEDAYLQIAKQAEARQQESQEAAIKRGDLLKIGNRLWSVSKGKFIEEPGSDPLTHLKKFVETLPPDVRKGAYSRAEAILEADPNDPKTAISEVMRYADAQQAEANRREDAAVRARKADPIITSQIGPVPDPKDFPQGANSPEYRVASKKWGIEAETIKERIASSAAEARGKGYGMYKPGAYIDQEGLVRTAFSGEAIAKGWIPFQPGFTSMSRTQQISEMKGASTSLRSAIQDLQPGDAFDAISVAQLRAAAGTEDPTLFHSVIDNLAASTTNPRQQDYLIWLGQMGERVLSLRNIAGMGQGAQDLRAAIQATLPGITSGSKEFAIKRLDAVDNQISILGRGIPHTNINSTQDGSDLDSILDKKFGKASQ